MKQGYALACDVGGSHIACALVRGGEVLARRELAVDPAQGLAPWLPTLSATLRACCDEAGFTPAGSAGVGIGFPGLIGSDGRIRQIPDGKYADAPDIDLSAWAADELGVGLRLDNGSAMLWRQPVETFPVTPSSAFGWPASGCLSWQNVCALGRSPDRSAAQVVLRAAIRW